MQKKRRRIMRDFRITEISAVDHPAVEHARMAIMKRADKEEFPGMVMQTIGGDHIASFDTLDAAVAAIAKAEGCPRWQAMSRAASRQPGLVQKYNADGERQVATLRAAGPARHLSKAGADIVKRFEDRVTEIARLDRCSRIVALQRAADELSPAEFESYRNAV